MSLDSLSRLSSAISVVLVLLCWNNPAISEVGSVRIADVPNWVQHIEWDKSITEARFGGGTESVIYILSDVQMCPSEGERYRQRVYRIANDAGVQQSLKVTFDFDPTYSELLLHEISIYRDGQSINKLDMDQVKIFQPEEHLSRGIYTGDKRCLAFLGDLRVDDTVIVKYTVKGRNPALQGHYAYRLPIQYVTPVELASFRLVWNNDLPISYQMRYSSLEPQSIIKGRQREYRWTIPPQPSAKYEDLTPYDFDETPYLEVSSHTSWKDVVDWGLKTYAEVDATLDEPTVDMLNGWQAEGLSQIELAGRVLRFVQDKIRYVGIEIGEGSFQPTSPAQTLQSRYGDCKGKSVLLCAMLQYLHIKAYPVLLNTYRRGDIAKSLPTPLAFNHAIAQIVIDDNVIWVDPTASHQRGSIF